MAQEQDPWAPFRNKPASPPPVPPPAQPRMPYSPAKVQQQVNQQQEQVRADTRIGIDQNQDARAAENHNIDMATVAANGGVNTQASQDQALFHAGNMQRSLDSMTAAVKANPKAAKPGWLETGVGWLTSDPTLLGYAQDWEGGSERQIAGSAAKSAAQSSVYLFTGAAAPKEQVDELRANLTPLQSDDAKTLQWKRGNMEAQIALARARAGPANTKLDAALQSLEGNLDFVYSPDLAAAQSKGEDDPAIRQKQIADMIPPLTMVEADEYETDEYPAEAAQAHQDWIRQNPNATFDDYLNFRRGLDQQYLPQDEFDPNFINENNYNNPEWREASEQWYNHVQAHPELSIDPPTYKRKLGQMESWLNFAAQSEPGVIGANFFNAGSAGLPELLAGQKSRRNFQRRNAESPWISTLSDGLGGVLPTSKLGRVLGKVLPKSLDEESAVRAAGVLAEGLYGGVRGANAADEDKRLSGALFGGGLSVLGARGGQSISAGSRAGMTPRMRENLDLTVGNLDQTLLQRMGKGDFEEGLQGLPLVRKARQKSIEGFNLDRGNRTLAAADEPALKGVEAGTDMNAIVNNSLSAKYNQLRPRIKGTFDAKFQQATDALVQPILRSGDSLKVDLLKEIHTAGRKFGKGTYDGLSFKDADQKLRQLSHDWNQVEVGPGIVNPSTYHEMARVADKFRTQLRAQVSRNDPVAGAALKKLDKAWAMKLQNENATNRAKGVYSPKQLLTTIQALDTSKGKGKSARGQALDQRYAQAAEETLGSAPTKEHTNPLQVSGAAYMLAKHPLLLGLPASALALSYAPGLNKISKALLTSKRSPGNERTIRGLIATILRKRGTENREEEK